MPAALLCSVLPSFETREEGQACGEVGVLSGFPGQADRFMKPGLGLGPSVRSRLIDRHVAQQQGQHADRGCAARRLERAVSKRPADVCLAQPD